MCQVKLINSMQTVSWINDAKEGKENYIVKICKRLLFNEDSLFKKYISLLKLHQNIFSVKSSTVQLNGALMLNKKYLAMLWGRKLSTNICSRSVSFCIFYPHACLCLNMTYLTLRFGNSEIMN
jgi:hypothetical protein